MINDSPGVKPATQQRVLAAIDALHYSPNLIARSMTSRRTGSIGVIVPFFTRPFFMEVLRAVEVTITQAGRELVLYNVQSNDQCDSYFRKLPKQRKVDGLLVISIFPDDAAAAGFKHAGMPVVLVDAYHPLLTSLVVDNVEGAYQAVKCLIEHGHRRIGFINGIIEGDFRFNRANDRLIGLHRAFGEVGMALFGCLFCDFLLEITQCYLTLHENLCIILVVAYRCNLHLYASTEIIHRFSCNVK